MTKPPKLPPPVRFYECTIIPAIIMGYGPNGMPRRIEFYVYPENLDGTVYPARPSHPSFTFDISLASWEYFNHLLDKIIIDRGNFGDGLMPVTVYTGIIKDGSARRRRKPNLKIVKRD
jgi:hypothetical protein